MTTICNENDIRAFPLPSKSEYRVQLPIANIWNSSAKVVWIGVRVTAIYGCNSVDERVTIKSRIVIRSIEVNAIALIKCVPVQVGFFNSNAMAKDTARVVACTISCVIDNNDITVSNTLVLV
jgi:hypothetical protein